MARMGELSCVERLSTVWLGPLGHLEMCRHRSRGDGGDGRDEGASGRFALLFYSSSAEPGACAPGPDNTTSTSV